MIEAPQHPDLAALEQRYAVFLDKLTTRGTELVTGAVQQLQQLMGSNTDDAPRVVDLVKMAANRQLASLNDKAYQVYTDKIVQLGGAYPSDSFFAFRDACYARFAALESTIRAWRDEIDEATRPDYEAELKQIQQDFEATKGLYRCRECGAELPVERMFFTDLYLTCPQCGAQNHLAPSAGARRLDFIARPLAERRHAVILAASHLPRQQAGILETAWRAQITRAEAGDQAAKAEAEQLCQQMTALNAQAEQAVRGYLGAVYTDMTELVPDHIGHYQKQYQQDLEVYLSGIVDDGARIDEMIQRTANAHRPKPPQPPARRASHDDGR